MSKQTEALKLALEALERHAELGLLAGSTITAIREALAEQPAQGCEFCSHPLYAGTKCKNCGREQPAQQQEMDRLHRQNEVLLREKSKAVAEAKEWFDKCQSLALAQQQEPVTILPDGSAFAVVSYPLPKEHWLYAERQYEEGAEEPIELGKPILTHALRDAVVAAVRYAIRGATNCGKESDFDPDALVKNAVYALCGPFTSPQPAQQQEPAPGYCKHCKQYTIEEPLPAQPSKPWVGLTDEEMRGLEKQFNAERVRTSDEEYLIIYPGDYWAWQRAIEAKLKEKNNG